MHGLFLMSTAHPHGRRKFSDPLSNVARAGGGRGEARFAVRAFVWLRVGGGGRASADPRRVGPSCPSRGLLPLPFTFGVGTFRSSVVS